MQRERNDGFTLVELSIVLVIIGLIVGGILIGRDLIEAASVRAQISQIEKYQTAVNTFRTKYGYMPGDLPGYIVTQLGFTAAPSRAGTAGRGDGNGELDGFSGTNAFAWAENGENFFVWEDLSTNSGLIEGNFNQYLDGQAGTCTSIANCNTFIPPSKIGGGNSVYVYSGYASNYGQCCTGIGPNFFGLSIVSSIGNSNMGGGAIPPAPGLTVLQAVNIDSKIDDGLPVSGHVMAQWLSTTANNGRPHWINQGALSTVTCFDNSTGVWAYSLSNGSLVNCALSFQFQ